MKTNGKKGFTLIELLIVIAIIGILAAALLPSIIGAPKAARDTARKVAVENVIVAVEQIKSTNGVIPGTTGKGYCLMDQTGSTGATDGVAVAAAIGALIKPNLATLTTAKNLDQAIATNTVCATGIYYYAENTGASSNKYYVCAGMEVTGAKPAADKLQGYYKILSFGAKPDPTVAENAYCIGGEG